MKKNLQTPGLLTALFILLCSASVAQNWTENFESYTNRDSSFKYGYSWQNFDLATSGAGTIIGKSAFSGSVNNPASPGILTTGYVKLNGGNYTVNFKHKTNNMSSSPNMKVILVDINGNEFATLFDQNYQNSSLKNSSFSISGLNGWYRLRFRASGNGGNSRISIDDISSTIAASSVTGTTTLLSNIQTSVNIIHYPFLNAITVTVTFVNNGPDIALRYGQTGTASLSNLIGINFNTYIASPGLQVDTVSKLITFSATSPAGWPVNSARTLIIIIPANYSNVYQLEADFTGFSLQEDPDNNNNDAIDYLSLGSLPITLESFTAVKQNNTVKTNWKVSDAVNFDHFELERSTDGSRFVTIARIGYSGNKAYSYTDIQPYVGKNYYRLKMVDIDGTYRYSEIQSVSFNSTGAMVKVYPTLVQKGGAININNTNGSTLAISLFDLSGKPVYNIKLDTSNKLFHLPQNLAASTYVLVVLDSSGNRQAMKISVQ